MIQARECSKVINLQERRGVVASAVASVTFLRFSWSATSSSLRADIAAMWMSRRFWGTSIEVSMLEMVAVQRAMSSPRPFAHFAALVVGSLAEAYFRAFAATLSASAFCFLLCFRSSASSSFFRLLSSASCAFSRAFFCVGVSPSKFGELAADAPDGDAADAPDSAAAAPPAECPAPKAPTCVTWTCE